MWNVAPATRFLAGNEAVFATMVYISFNLMQNQKNGGKLGDKVGKNRGCTVLAVSNCVEQDGTSYAVLKRVEVEF